MRIPRVASLVATLALLVSACSEAKKPPSTDDRVVINSDDDDLKDNVEDKDEPVDVEPAGAPNALVFAAPTDYVLTLVAQVSPPIVGGQSLQATAVVYDGQTAVVSYNTAGDTRRGAVDVFMFDAERRPTLTSRATFNDTDVSAVGLSQGRIYLATATADESFGTPAVLESLSLTSGGKIGLEGHARVALSSFAATSVAFDGANVFATSGSQGGLFQFDPITATVVDTQSLADARWVAAAGGGLLAVVQGTPGRITLVESNGLAPVTEIAFAGAQLAESKSTIEVLGGKAFVAGGPGGAFVIDLASKTLLANIPIPIGIPNILPVNMVANAVSADGDLMFISNGQAGVFLVKADTALATPWDTSTPAPTFTVVGRLAFQGEVESANHIVYKDGFLFVATGLGGLKIVKVEKVTRVGTKPTSYPYLSSFDDVEGQAGWVLDGAWGFGLPDGQRIGSAGAFLDNNPSGASQANTGPSYAYFDLPLELPATGFGQISFDYNASFLDPADKVELQIEDFGNAGVWVTKSTFSAQHARAGMSKHIAILDNYVGGIVRMRFAQTMGPTAGARRFTVDDLEITENVQRVVTYPFDTSFESDLDRSRWNLEGAWSWQNSDVFDGTTQLDINPTSRTLAGFDRMQNAEMQVFVPVPTTGNPVLGFWYRTDLVGVADAVLVQIQKRGEATWTELARFTPKSDRVSWGYREIPLNAFADTAVRVRFALSFDATVGARKLWLDAVRIGDLGGPTLTWPYACTFDNAVAASDWVSEGMLSVAASEGVGSAIVADPAMRTTSGNGHEARTAGFINVPRGVPVFLSVRAKLGFIDPADKIELSAQDKVTGAWTSLAVVGLSLTHADWTRYEVPLDAVADKSVRLRIAVTYGPTTGDRVIAFDDIKIEGLPTPRWTYPFARTFDATALAEWSITGAWKIVSAIIDANPGRVAQPNQGPGHEVLMGGFVTLPATGSPVLRLNLDLSLTDAADAVYVELQSAQTGAWESLRTYTSTANRAGFGWDELALSAWLGKDVRVRVRYQFGPGAGVRRLALSDLRIEAPTSTPFSYPWTTGFETTAQAAEWTYWGGFAVSAAHNGSSPAVGTKFLDGNPTDQIQSNWVFNQAIMNGYVALPAGSTSWLGFKHRFGAISSDDWLQIDVQQQGSSSWTALGTLTAEHVRSGYAGLELSLDAYRGKSVRVRFYAWLGSSTVVRKIGIDELWIGPQPHTTVPAPFTMSFSDSTAAGLWDLSGTWGVITPGTLAANPLNVGEMKSLATYHTASHTRFIDLAGVTLPVLKLAYTLDLFTLDDRAYVEVLAANASAWVPLATLNKANDKSSLTNGQWSLSAYAGGKVRVRLRIVTSSGGGKRNFTVNTMTVGPQ